MAAALLLLAQTADAASCSNKGTVVLTAGSDDSSAIVVSADCEETEVEVSKNALTASSMDIQEVLSAPDVKTMYGDEVAWCDEADGLTERSWTELLMPAVTCR
jgi:HJR/Mrr/RecB family endonuclease